MIQKPPEILLFPILIDFITKGELTSEKAATLALLLLQIYGHSS